MHRRSVGDTIPKGALASKGYELCARPQSARIPLMLLSLAPHPFARPFRTSNHSSAGNKALVAGQARGGGKDGLGLSLSPGGRRSVRSRRLQLQRVERHRVDRGCYLTPVQNPGLTIAAG